MHALPVAPDRGSPDEKEAQLWVGVETSQDWLAILLLCFLMPWRWGCMRKPNSFFKHLTLLHFLFCLSTAGKTHEKSHEAMSNTWATLHSFTKGYFSKRKIWVVGSRRDSEIWQAPFCHAVGLGRTALDLWLSKRLRFLLGGGVYFTSPHKAQHEFFTNRLLRFLVSDLSWRLNSTFELISAIRDKECEKGESKIWI